MPRQPRAGMARMEGEGFPEAAADWTLKGWGGGEREGSCWREGARSPADAKRNLMLVCTDQPQPPQSVFLNPYHSIPPILFWLLIYMKKGA